MRRILFITLSIFSTSLLVFTFLYVLVFSFINKIPENEIIKVYASANAVDSTSFRNTLIDDETIKDVLVSYTPESDEDYNETINVEALIYSDIIIIPLSVFNTIDDTDDHFVEITDDIFNNHSINKDDYSLVSVNDKTYGIIIYQKDAIDLFKNRIIFENSDETYIILANKNREIIDKSIDAIFKLIIKGN